VQPETLGFAFVGCGRISQRHFDVLVKEGIRGAKLIGCCDIVQERARKMGAEYNVPAFGSLDEMMAAVGDRVHVLTIMTESGNHARDALDGLRYGRHLVVEKPMALKLDDADEMIRSCDEKGVKLFVVKQNRFNLPVQKLRQALDAGRFGKMVMGTVRVRWCRPQEYYDLAPWRGTWALDGGVLTNQASHHVDLLQWCMGEPESVFAMTTTRLVNIEAEDTAVAVIRFRSGALGVVEATTATRPKDLEGSISILGEKGSVEIGGFAVNEMKTWNFVNPEPGDEEVLQKYRVNPPNVYGFGHSAYLNHVVQAIRGDAPSLVDGLEGRKSVELIMAIYESVETGREVFLRFRPARCRLGMPAEATR
jgi:UDP-N-acetyl-2-amino-2-deoxyglucuronate dehydrogenase